MGKFDGKVVVVTGSNRGIGKAVALDFDKEGAKVVAAARSGNVEGLSKNGLIAKCDITSEIEVKAMVDAAMKAFGRIDVLVNNAGITHNAPIQDLTEEAVFRVINTNLIGSIRVCRYVAPVMIKQQSGCIINISSITTRGLPNLTPYICAKAGLLALTRGLAVELAPYHIRVNSVVPGIVDTDMPRSFAEVLGLTPDETLKLLSEDYLLTDTLVVPEDVSEAVLFLAGNRNYTGAELAIDAGSLLK